MITAFFTLLATALSLLVVDLIVPGINIATFPAALIAALGIGFVNSFVRPVISIASLPINFLTLGTFSIVVNALSFWLASVLVPGFSVNNVLGAILGPIVLSFVNTFVSNYLGERRPELMGTKSELPKIDTSELPKIDTQTR